MYLIYGRITEDDGDDQRVTAESVIFSEDDDLEDKEEEMKEQLGEDAEVFSYDLDDEDDRKQMASVVTPGLIMTSVVNMDEEE